LQQAIMQHYNSSAAAVVVVGQEWGSHKEKEGRIHSPFIFLLAFFFLLINSTPEQYKKSTTK